MISEPLAVLAVIIAWVSGAAFGWALAAPPSEFRTGLRKGLSFGLWT